MRSHVESRYDLSERASQLNESSTEHSAAQSRPAIHSLVPRQPPQIQAARSGAPMIRTSNKPQPPRCLQTMRLEHERAIGYFDLESMK